MKRFLGKAAVLALAITVLVGLVRAGITVSTLFAPARPMLMTKELVEGIERVVSAPPSRAPASVSPAVVEYAASMTVATALTDEDKLALATGEPEQVSPLLERMLTETSRRDAQGMSSLAEGFSAVADRTDPRLGQVAARLLEDKLFSVALPRDVDEAALVRLATVFINTVSDPERRRFFFQRAVASAGENDALLSYFRARLAEEDPSQATESGP